MSRSRFVKPEVTRLYLADVHKREHHALLERTGAEQATPEQIAASEAKVAQAVEDAEFIDVKRRLNTGEQQDMFAVMAPFMTPNQPLQLQSRQVMTGKVVAYLIGWSLTDDGKPVKVSASAINNLDPETFREIREAIEFHEESVEKELAVVKNGQGGASVSTPPSVSVA